MSPAHANDLAEEIQARKESETWELRPCPCCGHVKPLVWQHEGLFVIMCGQWGCTEATAKTMADAAFIWNQKRFTDK